MEGYEFFCKSLNDLSAVFDVEESNSVVILLGMVGLYKNCFDQAVIIMKEFLKNKGFEDDELDSTESVIKNAFARGFLKEEQKWLDALKARKKCSQTFNQEVIIEIIRQIKATFYSLFESFKEETEKNRL